MTTPANKKHAFEVKRFAQPFTIEKLSESDGTFSGLGMVFNTLHPTSSWMLGSDWQDRVLPGAFTATLAEHSKAGTNPLMLYMHERGNIPGAWLALKETKTALVLDGQVSKNAVTPSGVPLLELMKMGAITGLSIGFRPTLVTLDEKTKVRDILALELGEISIVDVPANDQSRITNVKSARALEAGLRQLGLSKNEAKALLSEGFKAMSGASEGKKTAPAADPCPDCGVSPCVECPACCGDAADPEMPCSADCACETDCAKPQGKSIRSLAEQLKKTMQGHGETPGISGRDATGKRIVALSISDLAKTIRSS